MRNEDSPNPPPSVAFGGLCVYSSPSSGLGSKSGDPGWEALLSWGTLGPACFWPRGSESSRSRVCPCSQLDFAVPNRGLGPCHIHTVISPIPVICLPDLPPQHTHKRIHCLPIPPSADSTLDQLSIRISDPTEILSFVPQTSHLSFSWLADYLLQKYFLDS